jgi:cytochrome o ubiquinol oxidase subunit III
MTTEATLDMQNPAHGATLGHDAEDAHALGFWLYLMSDLIVFASLFATYVVLSENFAGGPTAKELFDLPYVLVETAFLLCASVAYGLGMIAARNGERSKALMALALAFLLGLCFVSMEVNEFALMIREGAGPDRSAFLSAFFTLVGTHGAHVSFGMLWMAVMMVQVATKGLSRPVQGRLMRLGMFWHFLDIVWIALFSVVYLLGVI